MSVNLNQGCTLNLLSRALPLGPRSARLLAITGETRLADLLPSDLQRQGAFAERGGFSGIIGKVAALNNVDDSVTILYGTSMPKGQGYREWDCNDDVNACRGIGFAVREARRFGVTDIDIVGLYPSNAFLVGYMAESANYEYVCGNIVTAKESGKPGAAILNLCVDDSISSAVKQGMIVGRARNLGRTLMNTPSSVLTTVGLHDAAVKVATDSSGKITATVFGRDRMKQEGFDLTCSIGDASDKLVNPPFVVILEYFGDPAGPDAPFVMLVGKGITHDLGGNNIKPDCADMHMDMGGAATTIATMQAVAELGIHRNVRAMVCCVQNAVGPNMTISGTPIYSRLLEKTVVVQNTDAEGRLWLAEAIAYAKKMWGDKILLGFDIATLTGLQALYNPDMSTAWGNQGDLAWQTHKVGLTVGDNITVGFLDYACFTDLEKSGGLYAFSNQSSRKGPGGMRAGGATAGAEFALQAIGGTIPWVHIDMAGGMEHGADSGEFAKGGDVPNVITLVRIMQDLPGFLQRAGIAPKV